MLVEGEFVERGAARLVPDEGVDEVGRDASGNVIVAVDERYFRPTEVETLLGDASKAKEKLGWTPQTSFEELVGESVKADFDEAKQDNLRAL